MLIHLTRFCETVECNLLLSNTSKYAARWCKTRFSGLQLQRRLRVSNILERGDGGPTQTVLWSHAAATWGLIWSASQLGVRQRSLLLLGLKPTE